MATFNGKPIKGQLLTRRFRIHFDYPDGRVMKIEDKETKK